MTSSAPVRRFRLAPLDVLTFLVLMVVIYLFVTPGSLAHTQFTQWLTLRETKAAIAGGVRIAVIHLPLSIYPRASAAARAAICAEGFVGGDALHGLLLRESAWQSESDFQSIGSSLPFVRDPEFTACLTAPATTETLRTHRAMADSLAIRATPTIFSRDGVFAVAPSVAALTAFAQQR